MGLQVSVGADGASAGGREWGRRGRARGQVILTMPSHALPGDSMSYHSGSVFSARDRDPNNLLISCAVSYRGAWWYRNCHYANLNGLYGSTVDHQVGAVEATGLHIGIWVTGAEVLSHEGLNFSCLKGSTVK